MNAAIWSVSTILVTLLEAWCLGRAVFDSLRVDARTRAAVGGVLGQMWMGFACANFCFELTLWIDPARTTQLPWLLHGLSVAAACAFLLRSHDARSRSTGRATLEVPQRTEALSASQIGLERVLTIVALIGCLHFGANGLAAVDALEVYQLKARALHAGTLETLAPRAAGSSHPLLLSSIVAWNAHLQGGVQDAMQVVLSISAWLLASLVFARALFERLPQAVAFWAALAFSLWPSWMVLAPRGEADCALVACVLTAAVAWTHGGKGARWLAIGFAVAAAGAKNEALAWIAIGGSFYLIGSAPYPSAEPVARRLAWAVVGASLVALLRWPATAVRARWGTFVEHVDGIPFDLIFDPLYLFSRGVPLIEALGAAGCGPSSGFAAWLWIAAAAFALRPTRRGCRLALAMGCAWLCLVFVGMLFGTYDAEWQAGVAAARVWLQASPWLFFALAAGGLAAFEGRPSSSERAGLKAAGPKE